ncbi:MAG: DNA translocase FtsK, partial [Acidobacteriota bacterium]
PVPEAAAPRPTAPLPPATPVPRPEPPEPRQEALESQAEIPELPPVNLLDTDRPVQHHDEVELAHRGDVIREACQHFGVAGEIAGVSPGPVITVYEFQPAPGVKVAKVVNLQDDLALALKADSVRIDRIPGRSTLGLEVPNDSRSVIHLGQLFAEPEFTKARSVLTMALGVDIHGKPLYFDLARMPHLLVAGATGAGKSVGLQSMITSILYKATKDEVKFIFIDPKRVELGVYSSIPHLKTEVVVEPKKAANALRWAVAEMERRYRLLASIHVRSIDIFNRVVGDPAERQRLALKDTGESDFTDDDLQPLPYYVIIIDELADLMLVAASEVETSIARLAQMARAVGIHLIIATQRPSVDVLTGTIKANFPCRLAFATATRHDSRTILDQVGAEKLLGRGDALFMPPGTSRIMRLHGAYISEQETAALVRWLGRRGGPDLDPDVVKPPEDEAGSAGSNADGEQDALFDDAARLVVRERQASASFLQRRMRVGFSRAARLIDMLEADGLLGPAQGSKPRDVLVPPDYFEEIDQHHDQE